MTKWYPPCKACTKSHPPHVQCAQADILTADAQHRKDKRIKTQFRPKYVANFRKPKQQGHGKR